MPTLFLHLGAPKTGSTYVQTALERGRDALAAAGIDYPAMVGRSLEREGDFLFGNYESLYDALEERTRSRSGRHLLISGESLHSHLQDVELVALLDRLRREAGFDRLATLLVLRDPVEQASSAYQQNIKQARFALDVSAHFSAYEAPTRSVQLLESMNGIGAEQTVRAFSAVRSDLIGFFEDWLEVPSGTLPRPQVEKINRGLTYAEIELQRALNLAAGDRAPKLGAELVRRVPGAAAYRPLPPVAEQQVMIDRIGPSMERLNTWLPEGERLEPRPIEPAPASLELSAEQVQALAQGLLAEIDRRAPVPRFPLADRWWRLAGRGLRQRSGREEARHLARMLRTAGRLSSPGGARAAEATSLLVLASSLRRTVPMSKWARWVGERTVATPALPAQQPLEGSEREVALALRRAVAELPFTTTCLDQAIAGSLLLRRRGFPARVVVGMNRLDPREEPHAWLIGGSGRVLAGGGPMEAYVPVTEFRHRGRVHHPGRSSTD